jgi:hypothetical protein
MIFAGAFHLCLADRCKTFDAAGRKRSLSVLQIDRAAEMLPAFNKVQ